MTPSPRTRRLDESDLPAAMRLKDAAGWNQTVEDWRTFLELAPDGCFAIEEDGEVVATSTALPYDGDFGWVGLVLVDPARRRRGLGTEVFLRAKAFLEEVGRTPALDATPEGRGVYEGHGFEAIGELERLIGDAPAGLEAHPACRALTASDMPAIATIDRDAFGANRTLLLERLAARTPDLALVLDGPAGIAGYLLARRGSRFTQLGPCVATDPSAGIALLETAMSRLTGHPIAVDVFRETPTRAHLDRIGLRVERLLTRMVRNPRHGAAPPGGSPDLIVAITGPEFG